MQPFSTAPFGDSITVHSILLTLNNLHGWEDKYRQVILWGKQLPAMPESLRTDQARISGCESQVWLVAEHTEGQWFFCADSDARIVRGLIAIILTAYQGKSSAEIQAFDMDAYFAQSDLFAHLSPSRGNGIRAVVEQIQGITQVSAE